MVKFSIHLNGRVFILPLRALVHVLFVVLLLCLVVPVWNCDHLAAEEGAG